MERVSFIGSDEGEWRVEEIRPIFGDSLAPAARLRRVESEDFLRPAASWVLHGVRSHDRYVTHDEKLRLTAIQDGLGRSPSTRAALIPIRKSADWWALPQDARRAIFE